MRSLSLSLFLAADLFLGGFSPAAGISSPRLLREEGTRAEVHQESETAPEAEDPLAAENALACQALPVLYQAIYDYCHETENGFDPLIDIRNVRVVHLKEHPVNRNGEDISSFFAGTRAFVEFSYFSSERLNGVDGDYQPLSYRSVFIKDDGSMGCSFSNPLDQYRSQSYSANYSGIVEAVTDLGDAWNGILSHEKPEGFEEEVVSAQGEKTEGSGEKAQDEEVTSTTRIVARLEDGSPLYLTTNPALPANKAEKAVVEKALAALKDAWEKSYKPSPDTLILQAPVVQIKNVRIIYLKLHPQTTNGKSVDALDGIGSIVEVLTYSNYYSSETTPIYLTARGAFPGVLVPRLGRMRALGMDLYSLYTMRFFDWDYSGVVTSVRDFGSQFNGYLLGTLGEKPESEDGEKPGTDASEQNETNKSDVGTDSKEGSGKEDSSKEDASQTSAEAVYKQHRIKITGGKFDMLDDEVLIYRLHVEYTADGDEAFLPFDTFQVRAFQHGREREDISDFGLPECAPLIQNVSPGQTVKADYLFEVDDKELPIRVTVRAVSEEEEILLETEIKEEK
ncbi:MAG: DUF5067 domain-containing protein [Lachnospiraceae bacterium]|nr:DUF5067 domain-containing protein [Lachnospiraceae bacterium]